MYVDWRATSSAQWVLRSHATLRLPLFCLHLRQLQHFSKWLMHCTCEPGSSNTETKYNSKNIFLEGGLLYKAKAPPSQTLNEVFESLRMPNKSCSLSGYSQAKWDSSWMLTDRPAAVSGCPKAKSKALPDTKEIDFHLSIAHLQYDCYYKLLLYSSLLWFKLKSYDVYAYLHICLLQSTFEITIDYSVRCTAILAIQLVNYYSPFQTIWYSTISTLRHQARSTLCVWQETFPGKEGKASSGLELIKSEWITIGLSGSLQNSPIA